MMSIGELARAGGVGVETIRYYQRRGLLDAPRRATATAAPRGIRHYGAGDLRRLRFVRSARNAGFSLDEIGELLRLDTTQDRPTARTMARHRIAALDRKIQELQEARSWLVRLADQCASSDVGPCPILEAFDGTAGQEPPRIGTGP